MIVTPSRNVHTMPQGDRWVNLQSSRVITRHRTQETAVAAGRTLATDANVEHLIHDQDGQIRERNNYGEDLGSPSR